MRQYLLQPADERSNQLSVLTLSLSIGELAVSVQLLLPLLPLYHELVFQHFLVVKELHECGSQLLLIWELPNEVLDDCLKEVLDS